MIAYFPIIYPDELLYSQLARYFTKLGYMAYTFAAEELFISKTVRPDIEFVNAYTHAAVQAITKNLSMEKVVEKHTFRIMADFCRGSVGREHFRLWYPWQEIFIISCRFPKARTVKLDICVTVLFVLRMTGSNTEKPIGIGFTK